MSQNIATIDDGCKTPISITWRNCIAVDPLAADMPPISDEAFAEMVTDIREHGIRNEVAIYCDADGNESILDGCTRLDAAEAAGLPVIKDGVLNFDVVPHRYVEGNVDRKAYIRAQNFLRRHLDSEQKRAAIAKLLTEDPERSNRDIGGEIGADHKTVAAERGRMESCGEIPHTGTRKDKGGRRQSAHKSKTKVHATNKPAVSVSTADASAAFPIPSDLSIPKWMDRSNTNNDDVGRNAPKIESAPAASIGTTIADATKSGELIAEVEKAIAGTKKKSTSLTTSAPGGSTVTTPAAALKPTILDLWREAAPEQRLADLSRILESVETEDLCRVLPPHLRRGLESRLINLHGLRRSDQLTKSLHKALHTNNPAEQVVAIATMKKALDADKLDFANTHVRVPMSRK